MARDLNDWKIPPAGSKEEDIVSAISAAIDQGSTFLKNQRAYSGIEKGIEFIAGADEEQLPESYSRVQVNRGKRQIREFVSTFSNMRPVAGFTSDDDALAPHVEVQNRMRKCWYNETAADRSYRKMYQIGSVQGTTYVRPWWDPEFHGPGRGDIALDVHDADDVIPVQVGRDGDLQKAYMVIIRMERPTFQVCEMFPTKQHLIQASRQSPRGMRGVIGRIKQKFASPALNVRGTGRGAQLETSVFPMTDLYLCYINDKSVNLGSKPIAMGEAGTTSYYEVPFLGQDLPTGVFAENGQPLTRKALRKDCLIYPRRRVVWVTDTHLMSDGPNPDWCTKVPLAKFQTDDWPWEFLGFSLTRDIAPMQDSMRTILRAMVDSVNAQLNPAISYDDQTTSKDLVDDFDPRQPGQTIGLNMSMGEQIKPLLPADYYKVQPEAFGLVDKFIEWMDHQLGTSQVAALSHLNQMPAGDSIEKILEAGGPLITDIARNIERTMKEEGEIWKCLSYQYYDTKRRVTALGDSALTNEDYDYDPGNAIPSHMPGEDPDKISRCNIYERAKFYMDRVRYQITENSILQIKMLSRRLYLLQLQKLGFPIDPWTIAEASDLNNFGEAPKGANTIMQRWVAWQQMNAEMKIELEQKLAAATGGAPAGGGGGESGGQRGRPSSNMGTARIEQKDGGTRSTLATS